MWEVIAELVDFWGKAGALWLVYIACKSSSQYRFRLRSLLYVYAFLWFTGIALFFGWTAHSPMVGVKIYVHLAVVGLCGLISGRREQKQP